MTDSQLAAAIGVAARSGRLNVENTWVSRSRRYFYMAVNKVASSKIKMILHRLEGYALPADPFDVHARDRPGVAFVGKLSAFEADEAVDVLSGPRWRRFAFVRNPYTRLYSAYTSKIADLASPYVGVRATIWRLAGRHQPPAGAPPFEAFVRYVIQQPDLERDGHWRSQTGALCLDLVDYGVIGRFERFEADFASILRSLDSPEELYRGLAEVVGASTTSSLASAYDAALAQLVHGAYAADFETFGYASDSWRGAG